MKTKFAILVCGGVAMLAVCFLAGNRSSLEPSTKTDKQIPTNSDRSAFFKSPETPRHGKQRVSRPSALVPPLDFDTPLNTEAEKQVFVDEAKKRHASELLSAWKQQLSKTNYAHLEFVEIAIANKIKDNPDSDEAHDIYRFARDAFESGALDEVGMIRFVKLLGSGGGASVAEVLLRWFDQTDDKELRREILSQLTSIGGRAGYSQSAEAVSHILEARWRTATIPSDLDSGLLPALGQAIAKTGNPAGIEVLLEEIARGGPTRQQFESESDDKSRLALVSLSQIRSEASVELLAQGMQQGSPDNMRLLASGDALADISKPSATKVLIDWARQADDANAPLVADWLSRLRDYDSRKMVRYLFIENVTFRSEQVKQAVAKAIKSYD